MAKKTDLIQQIRDKLTLNTGVTTRAQHEDFLHDESNSIVETIYASTIQETQTGGTITTAGTDFEYEIEISKVGRIVTMQLTVVNVSADYLDGKVFHLTDDEYLADTAQSTAYHFFTNSGVRGQIIISSSASQSDFNISSIPPSTSFRGTITYNAKN